MVNKYTLGSIVLSIFLLAILGVNRAINWLNRSTTTSERQEQQVVAVNADGLEEDSARIRASGQSVNSTAGDSATATSPLEEAGTYIQRQKRVGEDRIVTNTQVNVIPTASSNAPTTAQGNTTVTPQPQASRETSASPKPASTAVPALW